MSGKGDRDRTIDKDAYNQGWERVFGGNIDLIQEETPEDVGANPTSSTIRKVPFRAPPIRHGLRRVIE